MRLNCFKGEVYPDIELVLIKAEKLEEQVSKSLSKSIRNQVTQIDVIQLNNTVKYLASTSLICAVHTFV